MGLLSASAAEKFDYNIAFLNVWLFHIYIIKVQIPNHYLASVRQMLKETGLCNHIAVNKEH